MKLQATRTKCASAQQKVITAMLITFLVVFPKGGVMLGHIPITWGYAVLGLVTPLLLAGILVSKEVSIPYLSIAGMATVFPFQVLFIYSAAVNGVADLGFAISTAVSFFFLPIVFLMLIPHFWKQLPPEYFRKWFALSVFVVAAYGIFLFIWRIATGHLIEVPYLTLNAGGPENLATKDNMRGAIVKLIATYNNGNLYGVATLILLPLYDICERYRWRKAIVRIALAMTLSRTVWVGLVADQLLELAPGMWGRRQFSMQMVMRRWLGIAGAIIFCCAAVAIGMSLMGESFTFLADPTWGGRRGYMPHYTFSTFLPSVPVGPLTEMVYKSAISVYGYAGCASLVLLFASPPIFNAFRGSKDRFTGAAFKGLALYAILACADGAIEFIPVMAFYWFIYMVAVCGSPGKLVAQSFTTGKLFPFSPSAASVAPHVEIPESNI